MKRRGITNGLMAKKTNYFSGQKLCIWGSLDLVEQWIFQVSWQKEKKNVSNQNEMEFQSRGGMW